MRALAVFHDHGCHWLSWLLKKGFRHVFVAVESGNAWVRIDGMMGVPSVEIVSGSDFDLAGFYRGEGFTVIERTVGRETGLLPLAHNNCVGLAKAFLGVRSWAITPYQLHCRLKREQP